MKTKTKLIIAFACALSASLPLAFAACASADSTVSGLISRGYNVIVDFENGGGIFAGKKETTIEDFYRGEDLEKGILLQDPSGSDRGSAASPITYSGHFLVGWYTKRETRVNEKGEQLDEYGELCSVSGLEAGYSYENLWSFENSRLTPDTPDLVQEKRGGKNVYHLTLYPAWAPNFEYALYREGVDEKGEKTWVQYATVDKPVDGDSIPTPKWSEELGGIDYGEIEPYYVAPQAPQTSPDGTVIPAVAEQHFSLTGIYADPGLTEPYAENNLDTVHAESIPHTGKTDLVTGTATNIVVSLYTTWREGLWYRSTTAENFTAALFESNGAGHFELQNDLDFAGEDGAGVSWNSGLTFTGSIDGKNFSVKNIRSQQSDQTVFGGVFAAIGDRAALKDVSFENVDFTIQTATARNEGLYGLLAGSVSAQASLSGVTVTGTIRLGNLAEVGDPPYKNFTIGLLSGDMVNNAALAGMPSEGISVVVEKVKIGYNENFEDVLGWPVSAQVNEDGTVGVTKNADPQTDPNQTGN